MGADNLDHMESASVVSGWSMGDDVRDILYNDVESSIVSSEMFSFCFISSMSNSVT
jgi:hypothetical protein